MDRSAVGWDHREQVGELVTSETLGDLQRPPVFSFLSPLLVQVAKHESQVRQEDYKTGLGGARQEDNSGPVGTNYVKTKPESRGDWSYPPQCIIVFYL